MGVIDIYNSATLSLIKPSNNLHQAVVAQSPICLFQRNKQRRVIAMASTVPVEHVNDGQERVTGDSFIRSHLRKLSPYQPILPFEVIEALGSLKFPYIYPDPQSRRLREALAKDSGLDSDHILVGCGADELIDLIMRCTLDPGDKIVDCPPTFTMYAFDAAVNGALVTKGLAGLRVGYGAFPLSIIEFLWRAKQPYNVSVAAEVSACAALQNPTYLEPFPSYSNFILCEVKSGMDAKKLKDDLANMGVMVRHYNNKELKGFIRISVGKPEQTDILMQGLQQFY
ncbi:hypothetical protein Tsubulata_042132 [Turnera subulata]|uniref:histidinol-phosphate transaminase n=1 Tax=Turnera subulata TaxID=218843 RepID=A0A9Q0FYK8_9ROSI|nr:hypothetical protein Tsubulata_042132 [Turnera subulata]